MILRPKHLLLLMGLLSLSCSTNNSGSNNPISPGPSAKSSVDIGLSMKDAPTDVASIVGVLSRQGYDTLTSDFIISSDTAYCQFNDVPVGTWHLQVNAYNSSDTLKYTGGTDVQVFGGDVTPVSLVLNPATGSISVTVTWGNQGTNNTDMALEFDGTSGYVTFPASQVLQPQQCTVEFKVWFDSTGQGPFPLLGPTNADLYTQADGYAMYEENGDMGFSVAIQPNLGEPVVHRFTVPYHQWVYLAGTYDHNYLSLYIDGQLVATTSWSAPIWYGQHGFCLGKMYHSDIFPGVFFLKGAIDELKIWNYAMSQTQIDSTMNESLTGHEPGLVGYWNFNQSSSDRDALDRTGNGNNGQLIGGVQLVPVNSLPVQQ